MTEFAFDVDLAAVMLVDAENEDAAREKLVQIESIGGPEDLPFGVRMTEYGIYTHTPKCFEVDGKSVEEEE